MFRFVAIVPSPTIMPDGPLKVVFNAIDATVGRPDVKVHLGLVQDAVAIQIKVETIEWLVPNHNSNRSSRSLNTPREIELQDWSYP